MLETARLYAPVGSVSNILLEDEEFQVGTFGTLKLKKGSTDVRLLWLNFLNLHV